MASSINTLSWGKHKGQDIFLYDLINNNGVKVSITNFGATIQAIIVPDAKGHFDDVTLGYDDLQGYVDDPFYVGAIVGRYANRIAGENIKLDGKNYKVTIKEGGFHHHGGKEGFNKKVWLSKTFDNAKGQGVILTYESKDGEEGFPGNLETEVTYTLNDQDQIIVDFRAVTDKTTLINLTQHAYFNLAGHKSPSILDHKLMMPLDNYLPVNAMQVPNGVVTPVSNTPFDFRQSTALGARINNNDEQLILSKGYDHSWVIKDKNSSELKLAARVTEPQTKRVLNVFTTEPAVHLYTGNYLDENLPAKDGARYPERSGFCLETQHYPDAPNHPNFPSTVLKAGNVFKSRTIFEFGVER